jgi:protein-S-isoprenylcysteine O-methyltransferase Ste14
MPSWQKVARRIRVPLGFMFAVAYTWLAHPTLRSISLGGCISLIGLLIRALASGHVKKNEQLTTSGPYAHTRNPLYFGSLVLAAGFAVVSRSWWIALIAAAIFFAIYIPVIRGEEAFLRAHFPEFDEYAHHVPQLFPRLWAYRRSATSFSWELYWKHREYNATIGAVLMIAAMVTKAIVDATHR